MVQTPHYPSGNVLERSIIFIMLDVASNFFDQIINYKHDDKIKLHQYSAGG